MRGAGWRFWGLCVGAGVLSILTGCASVTQGTEQPVKVETFTAKGETLVGADCRLSNDKGSASVLSGQSALVRRSGGNLMMRCELSGQPAATGQAVSRANAGLAGNILLGGVLGAAVDVGTGAAYTYPTWVRLVFGEDRLYDRGDHRDNTVAAGTVVRSNLPATAERKEEAAVVAATPVAAPLPASPPAPAPTPPVVASSPALAAAKPQGPLALRQGNSLEYALIDGFTQVRTPVHYRVDRIDGDRILFNQGARIEKADGQLVSVSSPAGGLFDSASPPDGWGRPALAPGMRWRSEYTASNGEKARFELDASVVGTSRLTVDGADLTVQQIAYQGWMFAAVGNGPAQALPFKATAYYSPDMARVVRFEAEYRRVYLGMARETLELVRVWR